MYEDTKVRLPQGGDRLVVDGANGGMIVPASETQPAIADLVDSSTGTSGGNTIAAVTSLATAANAIATLTAKVNALTDALRAVGVLT